MERRILLLAVLSVVILVGWSFIYPVLFPPPPAPKPGQPRHSPAEPAPQAAPETPPPDKPLERRQPDVEERVTVLKNDLVSFRLTNRGAGVVEASVQLEGHGPIPLLRWYEASLPHLAVELDRSEQERRLDRDNPATENWSVTSEEPGRRIRYSFQLRNGLDLEKEFYLEPKSRSLRMLLTVRPKESQEPVRVRLILHALTGFEHDGPYRYEQFGAGVLGLKAEGGSHSLKAIPLAEVHSSGERSEGVEFVAPKAAGEPAPDWFGLRNRYFVALVNPGEGPESRWFTDFRFRPTVEKDPEAGSMKAISVEAVSRDLEVGAQQLVGQFQLFLSPIRREELAEVPGAERFLDYGCWGGWLHPIAGLILGLIRILSSIAGNYGVGILLTTVVVRLALFPLTRKSQVSMARMTELQPRMAALRERYSDDPQKMNQEVMKMYREHGVNPLSGCLPVFFQLPIWVALFMVLDTALEFRQAPFFLWIRDLSQPDRLVVLSKPIPLLLFELQELNLLPIIMMVTWFLQGYLAPRSEDPKVAAQQRMMMFLPLVFGFFCYSYASGLSLYLFFNSLMAIAELKIIRKFFLPPKAAPAR